jgi:hypothetical protein
LILPHFLFSTLKKKELEGIAISCGQVKASFNLTRQDWQII